MERIHRWIRFRRLCLTSGSAGLLPIEFTENVAGCDAPRSGIEARAMERGVDNDVIASWRWMAGLVIFPVTVYPGFHAVILVFSSFCFLLDSWSLEGAMTNLSRGFPAPAGITALWISTLLPLATVARTRSGFVLVTTGLMMGLLLECLLLKAGFGSEWSRFPALDLFQTCVFGLPMVMGVVNLVLLIRAREILSRPPVQAVRAAIRPSRRQWRIPPHHLDSAQILRPTVLRPYQPPRSTWSIP